MDPKILQALVANNLQSVEWFRPELVLTFGMMAVFVNGVDMSEKYKETSLGGLAVNVVEC